MLACRSKQELDALVRSLMQERKEWKELGNRYLKVSSTHLWQARIYLQSLPRYFLIRLKISATILSIQGYYFLMYQLPTRLSAFFSPVLQKPNVEIDTQNGVYPNNKTKTGSSDGPNSVLDDTCRLNPFRATRLVSDNTLNGCRLNLAFDATLFCQPVNKLVSACRA